ncbi:hypothetical protein HMI56_005061 [Coelomomyces lativittatus]|nr:hypothetical protein HMI56_005061 [Coelomomyces lativittatus]
MQVQPQAVQHPGTDEKDEQTESNQVQSYGISHPYSIPKDDTPPTPSPKEYPT